MRRIITILTLFIIMNSCNSCISTPASAYNNAPETFVKVEHCASYNYDIMVDRDTHVLYVYSLHSGTFTMLMNSNGSPKLFEQYYK